MILILAFFGAVLADPAIKVSPLPDVMSFAEWRAHFESEGTLFSMGKTLSEREAQFNANIEKIKKQNALNDAGLSGFRFGVNQWADLSPEEFGEAVGINKHARPERPEPRKNVWLNNTAATKIDWRTQNAVTPVKNQGQCGSCWSFSSTGAMEGAVAVATGTLVSLSEKQLCDCSTKNNGCQGGLMDYAFEYVIQNGGIDTEADYPYQPENGSCQRTKQSIHAAMISGYNDVTPNNADQLLAAVTNQPVSIAIEADQSVFQLYNGGVLDSYSCGTQLDHGVLVVGFTETNDAQFPDAWIVKNSWGPNWGLSGYIYITRSTRYSQSGVCGILEDPSYPTGGSLPGPSPGPPGPGPTPTPAPGSNNYENPFQVQGCHAGEMNVTLSQGTTAGAFCAPICSGPTDTSCPAAPSTFTATPSCNLVDDMVQLHFCSLTCSPYEDSSQSGCGAGSTCEVICNPSCNWLCVYHPGSEEEDEPELPQPTSGVARLHKLEAEAE